MPTKSLEVTIPDAAPFDQSESWFETFIGQQICRFVSSAGVKRYWFSRYGGVGSRKWILFRFECDDEAQVEAHVDQLRTTFPGKFEYIDYDYASDIGQGEGSRFLGDNGRHRDKQRRGELAFDFLHASAKLFIDGLKGPDAQGYFQREPETISRFSHETSLEQYLHLFCNMTGVPSFVVEATHPQHGNVILSEITFAMAHNHDQRWQGLKLSRVKF